MKYNKNQLFLLFSGGVWSIYDSLTSAFLVAFALMLNATNFEIGILGAIPYISALLIELPGAKLAEYLTRKKICIIAQTISRLSWTLPILIPHFFKTKPLLSLIIFYTWIKLTELISEPAWTSLAADIVPLKNRGTFFGTRNMLIGIAGMTTTVLAGMYLDIFPKQNPTGFTTIFATGIIFGTIASYILSKINEPKTTDNTHHTLKDIFTITGDFKKFCTFAIFFNFAVMLASPFFTVYMLKNLNMSYSYFTLATAISTIARITAQRKIGMLSDKFGDRQIALISIFGTAFIPFLFLFVTPQTMWLLIIAQVISGIVWAGADLTLFNLLLDLTKPEKRATQVAAYAMIISIPNIIAPLIGGLIADYGQIYVLQGIPLVFTISFILRLFTSVPLYAIHEPRTHKTYPLTQVFIHALTIHPIKGLDCRIRIAVKKIKNSTSIKLRGIF